MAPFTFRRRHNAEQVTPNRLSSSVSGDSDNAAMDALNALKHFEMMHHLDPNLPLEELCEVDAAINAANAEKGVEIEQILIEDNSPYPEVTYSGPRRSLPANAMRFRNADLESAYDRSEHRYETSMSTYP